MTECVSEWQLPTLSTLWDDKSAVRRNHRDSERSRCIVFTYLELLWKLYFTWMLKCTRFSTRSCMCLRCFECSFFAMVEILVATNELYTIIRRGSEMVGTKLSSDSLYFLSYYIELVTTTLPLSGIMSQEGLYCIQHGNSKLTSLLHA